MFTVSPTVPAARLLVQMCRLTVATHTEWPSYGIFGQLADWELNIQPKKVTRQQGIAKICDLPPKRGTSRARITPDCICKRKFLQHKLSLNKTTFWWFLGMTFTYTNHRHSLFSTIVALLSVEKMAGWWKAWPVSLQQSVKCPEWQHFRKMCHNNNQQLRDDQPYRKVGCSQVSQALPKAFSSGSLPVGAEVKNVLHSLVQGF